MRAARVLALAGLGLAVALYLRPRVAAAAGAAPEGASGAGALSGLRRAIGEAVDVSSPSNLAYRGANAALAAATGNATDTIGTALYNATHADYNANPRPALAPLPESLYVRERRQERTRGPLGLPKAGALRYVDPRSPDNVVNRGAGAASRWLGGSGSLGSDLYDGVQRLLGRPGYQP